MKIIIAPDSFKESLSAQAVAEAIDTGLRSVLPDLNTLCVPVADGGEGTTEALVAATGGELMTETVLDPLGREIQAHWGLLGTRNGEPLTAVVETASASGLERLMPAERDARITSTLGTGQLIRRALDHGASRIILGLGGSATNDGGAGLLSALGVRLLDVRGQPLAPGGLALNDLETLDLSALDPRARKAEFLVACDVDNPLLGERGASAVFGPQKGATPEQVQQLDGALTRFADRVEQTLGCSARDLPGAGAAGGLGFALVSVLNARLAPGIDLVLEAVQFGQILSDASLVITGEGRIDGQTLGGKTPVGVARWAKKRGIPVIALCGSIGEELERVNEQGIDALFSIVPGVVSLDTALEQGRANLERTSAQLARLLQIFGPQP